MCAYNSINGQPACANEFLPRISFAASGLPGLRGLRLRRSIDIFKGDHFKPTQAEASAISLQRGMDNECVDFTAKVSDDHDYKPYLDAVRQAISRRARSTLALTASLRRG